MMVHLSYQYLYIRMHYCGKEERNTIHGKEEEKEQRESVEYLNLQKKEPALNPPTQTPPLTSISSYVRRFVTVANSNKSSNSPDR